MALACWIACLLLIVVPLHGKRATSFHGGAPAQPKYRTAVAN
jgi:hypothetical protein